VSSVWLVTQHFFQPVKGPYNSSHQLSPFGLITPQDVGPSLGHKNLNSSAEKCQELAGDRFLSRAAQELRLGRFFMHTRRPKKIEELWLARFL
jgi:hypothetical protein